MPIDPRNQHQRIKTEESIGLELFHPWTPSQWFGLPSILAEPILHTAMGIMLELWFSCILQLTYISIFRYNLPVCKIFCSILLNQKSGVTLTIFKPVNFLLNNAPYICNIAKRAWSLSTGLWQILLIGMVLLEWFF